ncbi:MAG TPA: phosphoribosylformylglycinamidine synthase subunit PurS [Alphaproteobacteria bacterium]|nr:phosphoribosylformylglycinamidine synthase subunit PurS [Alphaproteobacteria bacterium]
MKVRVHVTLKRGILDPQGQAVAHALQGLGFKGVNDVRQGKLIELDLSAASAEEAKSQAEAMCRELLANPVTEGYQIEVLG